MSTKSWTNRKLKCCQLLTKETSGLKVITKAITLGTEKYNPSKVFYTISPITLTLNINCICLKRKDLTQLINLIHTRNSRKFRKFIRKAYQVDPTKCNNPNKICTKCTMILPILFRLRN